MKKIIIAITIFLSGQAVAQQNAHFSMWYASPSLLNPAATATMVQDFSLFSNFRSQYLTSLDVPFRTNAFSAEMKLGNEQMQSGWFGAGVHFINDATGDAKIITTAVSVPINYVFEMQDDAIFSIGFKPGIINRSLNTSFQTWENQWNGIGFDNTAITGESGAAKFTQFDIGTGVFFQKNWRNGSRYDIGLSANHLNGPNVTFGAITNQLSRQFLFHTSGTFHLDKYRFLLSPQIIAVVQGASRNVMFGSSIDFILKESSKRTNFVQEQTLGFGLNYRLNDAIVASVMLKLNGFQVGVSYDALLNVNREATNTAGAFELFLKYSFFKGQKRRYIR